MSASTSSPALQVNPIFGQRELEAVDSWAVLELMAGDRQTSERDEVGAHPMWIGYPTGTVVGPFSVSRTLERLAVIGATDLPLVRISGDLTRWWEPAQFVEMLGAPENPVEYETPRPPASMGELEATLRDDRPSGAVVVYDSNGVKQRALVVRSGKLLRDFGIRPLLDANARLLSGSLFEAMGVIQFAHQTLTEGRPLSAIAERKIYEAYDKARSILLRRAAASVLTREDGTFILAEISRKTSIA